MIEWNGLKFEVKPVPKNWQEELSEMRKKHDPRLEEAAIKAAVESRPFLTPKLSRQEVLDYFETLRAMPEMVKLFVAGREQYERDVDSEPDPIIYQKRRDFAEWWARKYTRHYEYSNEGPVAMLEVIVGMPIINYARGRPLDLCVKEIGQAMEKFNLK